MTTLKDTRKDHGLSQVDLAQMTGISQVVISNIESGKQVSQISTRKKIEDVLGAIDWMNTRPVRNVINKNFTLLDVENQFVKAIEMMLNLPENDKWNFMGSAENFFNKTIHLEMFKKELANNKTNLKNIFEPSNLTITKPGSINNENDT